MKFALFLAFLCIEFTAHAQTVDCSVSANCSDPYCQFAASIEKGCNCFDNIDNDGDGKADKADSNCATYYGLIFVGDNADCSILPPGVNDPFDMIDEPRVSSSQNTVDTQSKISVGDVDGDGIPDAVVTSKFNQILSVIATTDNQADGSDNGDQKAEFKLTGSGAKIFSGTGDCKPAKLYYELENMIADIDGDGVAEIFGIVGNRSGDGNNPPTCFWMVSFRYVNGELVPMYDAVQLGADRPGVFGIADMDGDGKAEIYMRDRIYAAETGALLATGGGNWDLDVTSGPIAVNVTGDNKMELITGTKIYSIPNLSNRNPATPASLTLVADMNTIDPAVKAYVKLAIDPIEYGTDTHSMTSVADVDRDGNMDVVISGALNSVSGPTTVFYWNVAKGTVSHYIVTDPAYANGWPWGTGRVNLGDANGDGQTDLTFIAGAYLHSLTTDASGNLVPLWPAPRKINDSRSGVLTVSIYDFNNDGDPEVVYRDSQELAVIDGATGQTKLWSAVCQSHTYTEGPVIADVNGDGSTDICVPCNTSKSFDINDPVQQQALGQIRLYFSTGNEWLPTRKVWNQPGYFVVNINDDLTLPFPQMDQNLVFGEGDCLNGLPGPQMPMNVFLNQVPYLAANGCPVYPAPDLSFVGDNPDNPGVDEDGDGVYSPTVEVIPPICGDLGISVRFNIINDGDLPISADIPVSFFIGDPTDPSITSDSLIHSATLPIVNLAVDSTYTSPLITFNGTGAAFRLYIVLNNAGTVLPIDPNGSVANECRIDNNIYSAFIQPDPFTTKIEKVQDNYKCENTAPDNGEVRVRIYKAGVEVTDYSQYAFQWYTGTTASYSPIAGATNYNLTGLAEGDYTAIVTNTAKGCVGIPVDTTIVRLGNDPEVVINVTSHQTVCNPPNGALQAEITGGNTGFIFEWFDIGLNPLGITGPTATNLVAGNYLVRVSKDGCAKNSLPQTIDGPVVPDAQAATLQNVVDCLNPTSGSVSATALFNGAAQDPANYSFDWYFYNNATATRGSILPAAHGTGETRTALPVGHYQVVVTDLATQCAAVQAPVTEITSQTVIPTAVITELAPQTSCDPADPNGRLQGAVDVGGVIQDASAYTFEWFKGDNTLVANAHGTVSGVNGSIADAVAGGGVFYTLRVTTANNCSDTEKLIITEDLNLPVVTLTPTDNGICDPALATSTYNGTVTASVTFDGVAVADFTNYEITWHDGSLATDPQIPSETAPLLDERNGGFYTVVVERTDLSCASAPVTAEVVNAVTLPTISTDSIPSTNCVGGAANGGVVVTGVLPADTYSYRWFDPSNALIAATTNSISGRQGGAGQNYTVEVTLGSTGCRNTFATIIPDNKENPILSLTPSDNSICDGTLGFNGAITSTFTDANAQAGHTYSYVWSVGNDLTSPIADQTGSSITERNGGFYTASIRNTILNCTSSPVTTEILNNQILPAIAAVPTPSTNCVGGADNGAITASVTNGLAGQTFSFQWSKGNMVSDPDVPVANGGNTATIINQQGNQNYIVLVTNDQTGCENTFIQAIADNSIVPVLTLLSTDNSICDAGLGYNGTVSRDVITDVNTNGTDSYSFVWSSGNDMSAPIAVTDPEDPTLTGRNGGFYTVTVENDRLGCVSNPVTIEVNNNQILPAIAATPTPSTNCDPALANGGITVSVTNALVGQTFTYEWHKGNLLADPAVPVLKGGNTATIFDQAGNQNYIVQARNNQTGCLNTLIETIADNSVVPVLTLSTTDNSICDAGLGYNGTVSRDVITDANADGTDTYSFVWSSGNDMSSPIAVTDPADPTLTGRNGGFYTVTVENNRLGCVSNPVTAEVNNNQILPDITANPTPSTNCDPALSNGAITVTIGNALVGQTFTYEWHKGNLLADPAVPALKGGNTATIFDQAGNQNYIVQARNNQTGCLNTLIQTIADNSIVPLLTLTTTDNSICDAGLGYNGTVSRDVITDVNASGTDTYSFVWSSGNDMLSAIAVSDPADPTLTGRNGGFYTATVENDRLGCVSNPVTIEVNNNQILPDITANPTPATNCDPALANGGITVSVTNALVGQSFTYEWHKGNLLADPAVPVLKGGNTATIFDQAGNQNYIVQARNNQTGCLNTLIQTIADNSVVPVLTLLTTDNSICDAGLGYNGTVSRDVITDINATGTDTYSFVWSSGNDMSTPIAVTDPADPTLTGRNGGFYTVTIENDRLGCVSNPVTAQVMNNQIFPDIASVPTPSTNCVGGTPNGRIAVSISNAVVGQTFSFDWYQGTLTSHPVVPVANGGQSATVTAIQGGLNYLVEATNDQTGCKNTFIQLLADESDVPVLTLSATENSICDPLLTYNGSISQNTLIDPNFTAGDIYTFAWATGNDMTMIIAGETASSLANRNGGFYTATVRNNTLNCTSNPVTIEILNNQVLPDLTATPTPSTNCDPTLANGAITVNVMNGLAGQTFTYEWHKGNTLADPAVPVANGGTSATISAQQGGFNYTVGVTIDQTGCDNTFTQALQDISALPTLTLNPTPNTICVPNPDYDGSIASVLTDANGQAGHGYTYAWSQGMDMTSVIAGETTSNLSELDGGFYTATVTNTTLGCKSNPVIVEVSDNLNLPAIALTPTPSTNCLGGDANGQILAAVTNGLAGNSFSYLWFVGNLDTDPAVLPALGGNTATIFGQQGGQNFTVKATINETGCQNTSTILLQDDSEIPVISPLGHTDNINCTAPFNGTAFVNAATPFTYRGSTITSPYTGYTLTWSGGTVAGDQTTALAAGTYSLQVRHDVDNCISTPVSVTILDDLTMPVVNVAVTDQTSCDPAQPNGQLLAQETSGVGSYTFDWFAGIGVGAVGAGLAEVSDGFTNPVLASDNYSVLVANTATRCETTVTSFLPDNITLPGLTLAQTSDVTVCATPNGELTAAPVLTSNADGDFTIYYLKQNTSNPAIVKTGFSSSDDADFVRPNLGPGYFASLVRDEITHCESQVVIVQIEDNTNPADITINAITTATFCNAGNDGAIDIDVNGGLAPFTFAWHVGGPTNAGPYDYIDDEDGTHSPTFNPDAVPFPLTTEDISLVAAGFYSVEVIDARGCGTVFSETVPFQDAPKIAVTKTNSTQCDPLNGDGGVRTEILGTSNYSVNVYLGLNLATAIPMANSVQFGMDGFDNDGDALTDVLDPDGDAGAFPLCADGIDNDLDGDIDSDDADCDAGLIAVCSNGIDDDGDGLIDSADPNCDGAFVSLSFAANTLDPGDYLVEIVDNTINCKIYKTAIISTDALSPVVTLGTIEPNTTCPGAVANFADGSVEIRIDKDPMDATVFVPNYVITSITAGSATPATNPGLYPLSVMPATSTVLFTNTGAAPYNFDGGFGAQTYTINVEETTSGCTTTQIVNIPNQPEIPQLLQVDITNESFCAPLSNGSAEVVAVNPVGVADYDYTWYEDAALSTVFYTAPGTGLGGGELLNASKNAAWLNPVTGLGMGTREFYVRGIRRAGTGPGAGCPTPAIKVVIEDEHVAPASTLSALPNTSCDPAVGEGSISISTTTASTNPLVAAATYLYNLDLGGVSLSALPNSNGALSTPFTALLDNAVPYNVYVTNEVNGCLSTNPIAVSPLSLPTQITNHTFANQLICLPNGNIQVTEIEIDRTATGGGTQTFNAALAGDFDFEWFRANPATPGTFDTTTPLEDNTAVDINRDVLQTGTGGGQYAAMGAGTYYVIATRKVGPTMPVVGLGCATPPLRVDIEDKHINPVVSLTPFSNTSCSTTIFEGEISVAVSDASPAAFGPFNYAYAWPTVTSGTTPAMVNPYTGVVATDGAFTGLEDGDYTITVTNNQTGCQTNATTTILKNTIPIFVTEAEKIDQFYCDPSGRLEITEVTYEDRNGVAQVAPIANFGFSWTKAGVGAVGTAQPLLDSAVNYPAISAGQYQVFATRTAGSPGLDCVSAPINMEILDKSVDPVLTLTPFSNTSCTAAFEGEIEVNITDASVAKVPPAAFLYDYTWTAVNPLALAVPAPQTGQNGLNNRYTALQEGTYRLTAENAVTGCSTSATTTIIKNQTPVFVQDVTMVPQFYCDPSGNLNVIDVKYNDRDGVTQNGPLNNFTYTWSKTTIANTIATTNPAAPAVGHTGTELDSVVYATIGADSYWVVATRAIGTPGAGCSSAPFRIDISDERIDPVIELTPFSNTSCTAAFEGQIEVDVTDASAAKVPATAFAYDYVWSAVNPLGLTLPPNQAAQNGVNNLYTGLQDGTYQLQVENTVTGCTSSATTTIIKNQTPVFLTVVNPTPQFFCDPSGRLEVTGVSYTDRNGVNQVGALADFTFDWARNSVGNNIAQTLGSAARGAFLDSLAYPAIGFDSYYVVATRTNGAPGAGCASAPIKVDITDMREYPVIALTPFSNTSCTTAFEGQIEIDIADNSATKVAPSLDAGQPVIYDYTWTDVNTAGLALPAAAAGQTGSSNVYSNLEDGTYKLTAVNTITGCSSEATTTIIKNQTPVFLTVVNPTPQFYCDPSGRLQVTGVSYTDRNGANQVGALADFTFDWARGTVGNNIAQTLGSTARGAFLDSLAYPAIGFDSYYVVATRTNGAPGAGCASAPIKVDVTDMREYPVIALTPFSNTSCTTVFEGQIEIDIADNSATKVAPSLDAGQPVLYDYTWTDVNTAGLALPAAAAGQTGSSNVYSNLEDGTYKLTAVNTITGCSSEATTTIIKNQTPVFLTVVNATPQFYCDPSGRLEVTGVSYTDRNGANQVGALADFTFDWARSTVGNNIAQTLGNAPRGAFLDSLAYPAIGFDSYYVVATRTNGAPGAGCASAPIKVDVTDMREYPVIALTPYSNTSCTTAFEGQIEIDIADNSATKVTPSLDAGQPVLYDYTWADVNTAGLTLPAPAAGQTGLSNVYSSLEDGTYKLTAVNTITGCSSEATTTIIKNQTPIFVQDVAMVPQLYCGPSGHLEVRSISYNDRAGVSQAGPLADFTFAWTRNDLLTPAGNTDGSLVRGTFLDSLSYAGPGTIGFGTYYVVATRNTGAPGAGCQSAPFKMDITDERESPVVNFTTIANTACDNNFDGQITVLSSNAKAPGTGANYDIQWISLPAGNSLAPAAGVGASYTTPLTDIIGPGSFTVRVTNATTNCSSDAVVTMISNPQPVEILTVNKLDQMICFPDGSITVSAVSPAVVPDYNFTWYRNDAATPALVDGGNATIIAPTLDNTNYPTMGADTYFVVGQKLTALGSGCFTAPFRVNIDDLHVDPTVAFAFTPNSSCDVTDPNGQIIATASERDGTTDNYTFGWSFNGTPGLPTETSQSGISPISQLDDAYEGQYVLVATNTVTGCDVTGGIEVNLDHNISLPNIITVDTFDPLDCLGSGSAEVTAISVGGAAPIVPPNIAVNFQFEWYEDDFVPANQLGTTTPLLGNINAGRYFVRVQDLTTDCKSSPTEVVILEDNIVYPVVTIDQSALQVRCTSDQGTAELIAYGDGNTGAPYQFSWFNNLETSGPAFSNTSTISDLMHGEYSVLVLNNATGCSASEIYVVRDDSERYLPQVSLNTEARIDCVNPDGALLAREVGYDQNDLGYPYPSANYSAEWYMGANADVSQPGTVLNNITGFTRNWREASLDFGDYTVKITDNNTGCITTGVVTVADGRVLPVVTIVEDNPLINCDPARPNGQLSATADGGKVGGYLFDWYDGTTASGLVRTTNNKLIGIGLGDYTVRVTNDFTNCFADATASVTNGQLTPPTPTAVLVFDRTRCDFPDGWVSANVGGITFNYSFDWYDGSALKSAPDFNGINYKNRDIGAYTVTAMDEVTGCISLPTSVEVKDLRVIPEVVIRTTPSYCEELPGSVGGTGTAEVQLVPANVATDEVYWSLQPDASTIGIGSYITNVLPGFYQADVVTSQGCEATGVGEVKTEVFSYNLVSTNGDNKNDNFRIDCITQYPNNNVKIFNRAGVLVYEADGYDNNDVVFRGMGEKGVYTIGNELPVGTYFYVIDKRDGSKPKTGYLELVR